MPVETAQVSVVHTSESSQSATPVQQFAFFVGTQAKFVHVSVVQTLGATQSVSTLQHPATGELPQTPATHVLIVQRLPSSGQSPGTVQGPAA